MAKWFIKVQLGQSVQALTWVIIGDRVGQKQQLMGWISSDIILVWHHVTKDASGNTFNKWSRCAALFSSVVAECGRNDPVCKF